MDRTEPRRGTGIVATLGPATDSFEQLRALVKAGMDLARLNMAHGTWAEHEERYRRVRAVAAEAGRHVGILADFPGARLSLGAFADGRVGLEQGDRFILTVEDVLGDQSICTVAYPLLPNDVSVGDPILVNDGAVELQVTAVDGPRVITTVVTAGLVSDHKSLSLPRSVLSSRPMLSPKIADDLRFALRLGCDGVAVSFVRRAADVQEVHRIMDEEGHRLPVIAKIETPEAVENLEEILRAFDGIMIARGDLGVELPLDQVPIVQKRAIRLARHDNKPTIVATQLLDSMIQAPRPTRAEASDVANGVMDGADALMLSGETSVGHYPQLAVETMARIIATTEEDMTANGLTLAHGIPASWTGQHHSRGGPRQSLP
ncbi:hypothetical protein AQI88_16535 [Streptomyces cellostaticus]|uniref:Pyruvate kinase n=1 Tax=Streptomyces cellostaticus TaxID=67285 RepID=A0A101NMG9_9ACTN|nr:hypothetical protein AQI88_16535 [Streptomyces cellostaticus]